MPDDPTPDPQGDGGKPDKTFTQADLDRIVADRLKREQQKYADYDDLKTKAAKLDEIEQANQSEVEKAQGKAAKAEQKATEAEKRALRLEVALEKGLTATQAKRLIGDTKEELEADADELVASFKDSDEGSDDPVRGRPTETLRPGATPSAQPEEMDPRKLADAVSTRW